MPKLIRPLALVGLLGLPCPVLAADAYKVDTVHSAVLFKAHHFDAGYTWGRFNAFEGRFQVDGQAPSQIEITVTAESVDTHNDKRDRHLRGPDFLEVETHPQITFSSRTVERVDEDTWRVVGELSLHGVRREISTEVHHTGEGKDPWGGYRIGYETSFTISMKDFGIEKSGVGDTLTLVVSLEGKRR